MCDYSLESFRSREAKVGDQLITGRIQRQNLIGAWGYNSLTRGLYAEDDPGCAVCLKPGTELAFPDVVRFYHKPINTRYETATFIQVNTETGHVHHDALRFPDGTIRLVNDLAEGQKLTVLQLPKQSKEDAEEQATKALAKKQQVNIR
jgi:hypothetical protein